MSQSFILGLTLGIGLNASPAHPGQAGGKKESAEPPKSVAELLREFRAEEVEEGKSPQVLERILIRPEDLPGFAPHGPLNGFWRKDQVLLGHSFYHLASEDRQNDQWKGRRILSIRYYLFDQREQALSDWWTYPGRIQARCVVPRGTSSGEPLGVELCWGGSGISGSDSPALWRYRLYILWKGNLTGEVSIFGVGTRMKQPVQREEIYLVENVARKVLANLEERPFEVTTGPPPDWIVKPATLLVQGRPLTVSRKRYTSGWRYPLEGGPARPDLEYEMTPLKPVLWEGQVLVARPVLEALGLQVETGEWDPWREAKDDQGDYLEWVGPMGLNRFVAWDPTPKRVVVSQDEHRITFTVGEKTAKKADGTTCPLKVAPRWLDGFPVVPLVTVAEEFNLNVQAEQPTMPLSIDRRIAPWSRLSLGAIGIGWLALCLRWLARWRGR